MPEECTRYGAHRYETAVSVTSGPIWGYRSACDGGDTSCKAGTWHKEAKEKQQRVCRAGTGFSTTDTDASFFSGRSAGGLCPGDLAGMKDSNDKDAQ